MGDIAIPYGPAANLAYLGFLVLATIVSGEYFERTRRYLAAELARAALIAAMLAANLAAAAAIDQLGRRRRASSIAVRAAIRSRAS